MAITACGAREGHKAHDICPDARTRPLIRVPHAGAWHAALCQCRQCRVWHTVVQSAGHSKVTRAWSPTHASATEPLAAGEQPKADKQPKADAEKSAPADCHSHATDRHRLHFFRAIPGVPAATPQQAQTPPSGGGGSWPWKRCLPKMGCGPPPPSWKCAGFGSPCMRMGGLRGESAWCKSWGGHAAETWASGMPGMAHIHG